MKLIFSLLVLSFTLQSFAKKDTAVYGDFVIGTAFVDLSNRFGSDEAIEKKIVKDARKVIKKHEDEFCEAGKSLKVINVNTESTMYKECEVFGSDKSVCTGTVFINYTCN